MSRWTADVGVSSSHRGRGSLGIGLAFRVSATDGRSSVARRLGKLSDAGQDLLEEVMKVDKEAPRAKASCGKRQAYRVRLPGFVREDDIGLGDVITKSTSALGIKPCVGCGRRAAVLNQWLVFSGRAGEGRRETASGFGG